MDKRVITNLIITQPVDHLFTACNCYNYDSLLKMKFGMCFVQNKIGRAHV